VVKGPKVAEKLIPIAYDFGTRRVPLEANYFEAFNRGKENPIERLTETGVQTPDGRVHRLDILVLATGFDAAPAP
jgi:acetone monooxygenase